MNTSTTTISAQIPKSLANKLSALVSAESRSKSYYIKEALVRFLDEKTNDIQDYIEAEKRYHDFLSYDDTTVSLDDIAKKYDL